MLSASTGFCRRYDKILVCFSVYSVDDTRVSRCQRWCGDGDCLHTTLNKRLYNRLLTRQQCTIYDKKSPYRRQVSRSHFRLRSLRQHYKFIGLLLFNLVFYRSSDCSRSTIVISLHLSAAFGTVDHNTLLSHYHSSFVIPDTVLSWLQSFTSQAVSDVTALQLLSKLPVFLRLCFITVRLHVMQRTVLLSQFCLSVRCVYCDKTKQRTANILIPHETAITVVF